MVRLSFGSFLDPLGDVLEKLDECNQQGSVLEELDKCNQQGSVLEKLDKSRLIRICFIVQPACIQVQDALYRMYWYAFVHSPVRIVCASYQYSPS